MEAELGNFFCISALCLSVMLTINYCMTGLNSSYSLEFTKKLPSLIFVLIGISFIFLLITFVSSDFSVKLVANNSHSLKPLIYKISGAWGNHEGSMLLWVLILAFYLMIFQTFSKELPRELVKNTVFVQLLVISLFLFYLIFLSNPFERLDTPPIEGQGLNPILQDVLLAFHPPTLYLGYLGLSVPFSLSIGFLISKNQEFDISRAIRSWTLLSFFFLTIGIMLGSIWAYYELGWGGWWFWDPVENVSLLPWLLTLSLIHALLILEHKGVLISWVLLISIMCFSFSLIGTFVVRSGLLTSVHAFANDPARGIFILLLVFLAISVGLIIFMFRRPLVSVPSSFKFLSRELWLLLNNLILLVMTSIIFLGTIWPFLIEVIYGDQVSVGKPFFDLSLTPFVIIFSFLLPIASKLNWNGNKIKNFSYFIFLLLMCLFTAFAVLLWKSISFLSFLGFFLSFWILYSSLWEILKAFNLRSLGPVLFYKSYKNNRRLIGKVVSHAGFGVLVFGVTAVTSWETEDFRYMVIGDQLEINGYTISFKEINFYQETNYKKVVGKFKILEDDRLVGELFPEKRFYVSRKEVTTEAAIRPNFLNDIYLVLGNKLEDKKWVVRVYVKPFISFIWLGVVFIAMGSIISLTARLGKSKNSNLNSLNSLEN